MRSGGRQHKVAVGDVVEIDRARIEANASDRLESVLADVAGLQQFRRSDSRSANPTSQGITLRGLGGNAASRALLILDGVPQADPFGGWVAFPAYATDRIGRIRVTRGGGSGFYGAGALAGTVVTFVGDGNNVYHSLALLGVAFGMEVRLAHPTGYGPNEAIVATAQSRPYSVSARRGPMRSASLPPSSMQHA